MAERPVRLTMPAVRVFKACRALVWGCKAVWLEDWTLDMGPEGAWISASNLAARIGMSKDNVEEHRRVLRRADLYFVIERPGARANGWIPMMPEMCKPRVTRPEPAEILELAFRLDEHIRGRLDGGISGLPQPTIHGGPAPATDGVAQSATHGVPTSATRSGGGVRGGAPSSVSSILQDMGHIPPSSPSSKDGEAGGLHMQPGRMEKRERAS